MVKKDFIFLAEPFISDLSQELKVREHICQIFFFANILHVYLKEALLFVFFKYFCYLI